MTDGEAYAITIFRAFAAELKKRYSCPGDDAISTVIDSIETVLRKIEWEHFDSMTDEERHAAALADPDAQPWTEEELKKAKVVKRRR